MLSVSFVNAEQAKSYFEHSENYYTKNLSNNDRWYGTQSKMFGLGKEMSKEEFDVIMDELTKTNRKRAGLDMTFSVPKSVSVLAAADPKLKGIIVDCLNETMKEFSQKIELECVHTRDAKGNDVITGNALFAGFLHQTARPTAANNFVPDPDIHCHLIWINNTIGPDGKSHAVNYKPILQNGSVKNWGLDCRSIFAQKLQEHGIPLEITDAKQGLWEVKGISREIIDGLSHREHETKEFAEEHGVTDLKKANLMSRSSKSKSVLSDEEVFEKVKRDYFDSGKINLNKIVNLKEGIKNERITKQRESENVTVTRQAHDDSARRDVPHITDPRRDEIPDFTAAPSIASLPDLPARGMDAPEQWGRDDKLDVLLPQDKLFDLAKLQKQQSRDYFMRRSQAASKRSASWGRIRRIREETEKVIKDAFAAEYAVPVKDLTYKIKAANVLDGVDDKEAGKLIEHFGLVRLGQRDGAKGRNQFLTTRDNIRKEQYIKDFVKNGKGYFRDSPFVMTPEDAYAALERADERANDGISLSHPPAGVSDEQAKAIIQILTSTDRVVVVDGLAGTGKTTMLQRLNLIYEEQQTKVYGACYTGKAADGLETESRIKSSTIHGFLGAVERGDLNPGYKKPGGRQQVRGKVPAPELYWHKQKQQQKGIKQSWSTENVKRLDAPAVEIMDEAGLINTNLMYENMKLMNALGPMKMVILGDTSQLASIGTGEPMKAIEEAGAPTARTTEIRRQKDMKLREAVYAAVDGNHLKTYEILDRKGDYIEIKDTKERRAAVVAEMTQIAPQDYLQGEKLEKLLLVSTNADRKMYNKAIRDVYVSRGLLDRGQEYTITTTKGDDVVSEKRNFAVDDRVIFTANDNRINVKNGSMGRIAAINGDNFTVAMDNGKTVSFSIKDYNRLDHSYAVTNYKAQGMTVNNVVIDMSTKGPKQTRNGLYVDISRARWNAKIYTDDKKRVERDTRDFVRKITGKDFQARLDKLEDGITGNDLYKAPADIYKDRLEAQQKRADKLLEAARERQARWRKQFRTPPRLTDRYKAVDKGGRGEGRGKGKYQELTLER